MVPQECPYRWTLSICNADNSCVYLFDKVVDRHQRGIRYCVRASTAQLIKCNYLPVFTQEGSKDLNNNWEYRDHHAT